MKKLLWALLAALPMQAAANDGDPIAYKCYYCTPAEMEDVALAQGVGQHYVYDAQKRVIRGYNVLFQGGVLNAQPFEPEQWLKAQFLGMMSLYSPQSGEMFAFLETVSLLAPGTEHGRSGSYMWGQDLTALNPHHGAARETIRRYLNEHPDLAFLDMSASGGKLLMFEYMLGENRPITAYMNFPGTNYSPTRFHYDHADRRWHYDWNMLPQGGLDELVQETREDFAPSDGDNHFEYRKREHRYYTAFVERAKWAGIPVHGIIPPYADFRFTCTRVADDIQCHVK